MKISPAYLLMLSSLKVINAQQIGQYEIEGQPYITLKEYIIAGGCTSRQAKLTLDANWR